MKKALRPAVQLCSRSSHEDRAFIADAVDVGRLTNHQAAVIDARLHPADVVAHDEQDVGLVLLRDRSLRWQSEAKYRCHKRSSGTQTAYRVIHDLSFHDGNLNRRAA